MLMQPANAAHAAGKMQLMQLMQSAKCKASQNGGDGGLKQHKNRLCIFTVFDFSFAYLQANHKAYAIQCGELTLKVV